MPTAIQALLFAGCSVPALFILRWVAAYALDMVGLRAYPRQIVRITPAKPVSLKLGRGTSAASGNPRNGESKEKSLTEWISDNVPSLKGTFTPSWWLPNGHFQTIYHVFGDFSGIDQVEYVRTYLRQPDGGTIGLDFTPPHHATLPPDTPTIVVCHGLTGGSHESYVRNVMAWAVKPKSEGGLAARGIVVNFRGCAGVPLTTPQLYSAGTTIDLHTALHYIRHQYPSSALHGIGFSLGASVLARYMGESSGTSLLSSGIILGCPWNLPANSIKLENSFLLRKVYSEAMAQNLVKLFFSHYDRNPAMFEKANVPDAHCLGVLKQYRKQGKGFRLKDVDDVLTCQVGGPRREGMWPFDGADDYYSWATPHKFVERIRRPALSISAFDDPICDGQSLPLDKFANTPYMVAAVTGSGGHLGWYDGAFGAKTRWIIEPIKEFLTAATQDFPLEGGQVRLEEGEAGTPIRSTNVHNMDAESVDKAIQRGAAAKALAAQPKGSEYVTGSEGSSGADGAATPYAGGWQWVANPSHDCGQRVGWRVLREGEVIEGAEGSGVLQGL